MTGKLFHQSLNYLIATVWLINGLICKVLNFVPRHTLIVERIVGSLNADMITKVIGIGEIIIGIWIISSLKSRVCAIFQIVIVATMNIIEFFAARDLLLFGKLNAFIAFAFIIVIYYNEFIINRDLGQQT